MIFIIFSVAQCKIFRTLLFIPQCCLCTREFPDNQPEARYACILAVCCSAPVGRKRAKLKLLPPILCCRQIGFPPTSHVLRIRIRVECLSCSAEGGRIGLWTFFASLLINKKTSFYIIDIPNLIKKKLFSVAFRVM